MTLTLPPSSQLPPSAANASATATQTNPQAQETPREQRHHSSFHGGMHRGVVFRHAPRRSPPPPSNKARNGPKARVRRAGARSAQMGHEEDEFHGLHPEDLKEMLDAAWAQTHNDADAAHQGDSREAAAQRLMEQHAEQMRRKESDMSLPRCKPVGGARPKAAGNDSLSKKNWSGAELLFGPKVSTPPAPRDLSLALASVYFAISRDPVSAIPLMASSQRTAARHGAMQAYMDLAAEQAVESATLADVKAIALEMFPHGGPRGAKGGSSDSQNPERQKIAQPASPDQQRERGNSENTHLLFIPYMLTALRRRTETQRKASAVRHEALQTGAKLRMPPKTPSPMGGLKPGQNARPVSAPWVKKP